MAYVDNPMGSSVVTGEGAMGASVGDMSWSKNPSGEWWGAGGSRGGLRGRRCVIENEEPPSGGNGTKTKIKQTLPRHGARKKDIALGLRPPFRNLHPVIAIDVSTYPQP